MRKHKRDDNEEDIVSALRAVGCSVLVIDNERSGGVPDLLVACQGHMWLVEVKAPGKEMNGKQEDWAKEWRAPVHVVHDEVEALRLVERL